MKDDTEDKGNKRQTQRHSVNEEVSSPKRARLSDGNVEPASAGNYEDVASVYFEKDIFFRNDEDKAEFVSKLGNLNPETKQLLAMSVHQFYRTAWKKCPTNDKMTIFFMENIKSCKSQAVLEDFYKWRRDTKVVSIDTDNQDRMVNVGFQIAETKLSHKYDLTSFSKHIDGLFGICTDPMQLRKYVGPYFCFVQSSGMGKTKILWEYRKLTKENKTVHSFLIIQKEQREKEQDPVFDYSLDLTLAVPEVASMEGPDNTPLTEGQKEKMRLKAPGVAEQIYMALDKMLRSLKKVCGIEKEKQGTNKRIALLFDESQTLLKEEFGYKAFRFRCLRIWLREKRPGYTVVAVFTGTNSRLTSFLFESDTELTLPGEADTSRDWQLPTGSKVKYYTKGFLLYPPFYRTTTIGSCLDLVPKVVGISEYDRAVYFGRPLFALMAKENRLERNIHKVLYRMLCSHIWKVDDTGTTANEQTVSVETTTNEQEITGNEEPVTTETTANEQSVATETKAQPWTNVIWACINLFATRVQMGQTSAEVASELVANSYANFCGYISGSRTILLGYFPDPVCARLAMCMMDETYRAEVTVRSETHFIKGQSKEWWTGKLKEIFTSGIVSPEKGNFGEVVVALYMLFCGDMLRMQINRKGKERMDKERMEKEEQSSDVSETKIQEYSQFSVSLDDWLQLILSGGKVPDNKETPVTTDCKISVGFIQVCRNSLRSYSHSWNHLSDQCFLKHIYESGIAFYTCNNCPVIDMVVPLRIRRDGESIEYFAPMLVSIKCHTSFTQTQANLECKKMKDRAIKDGLGKALCLLIVFGSGKAKPFADFETADTVVTQKSDLGIKGSSVSDLLLEKGLVAKAIRIPFDDKFGLSALFNDMTPIGHIDSELLAAHTFLMAHQKAKDEKVDDVLNSRKALYSHATVSWREDYTLLRNAMVGSEIQEA